MYQNETKFYKFNGYNGYHNCREARGGGTSIYVKNNLQQEEIESIYKNYVNIIGVKLTDFHLNIYAIYRSQKNKINDFLPKLEEIVTGKNNIIIGDININLNLKNTNKDIVSYKETVHSNFYKFLNKVRNTRCDKETKTNIDHVILPNKMTGKVDLQYTPISDHKK
ncbi:hypothetical protein WA026_004343 [Henosepilachna vigintioctopunctata]|uniref:Uncharacterized protein n=1 Tax=Henosepilachna vigintioctopunctata TaxID=420089 RepID=A0AAW1V7T3_9CUCU